MQNEVPVRVYERSFYVSSSDLVHDTPDIIKDVYIPSKNISFNYYGDKLNIFQMEYSDDSNYHETTVCEKLIDQLYQIYLEQQHLDVKKEAFHNKIKRKFKFF
jgi:hypothetical protein